MREVARTSTFLSTSDIVPTDTGTQYSRTFLPHSGTSRPCSRLSRVSFCLNPRLINLFRNKVVF